jgi:hypothetical protein
MRYGTLAWYGPYGVKRFLITTNSVVGNDTLVAIQFEGDILCNHTPPKLNVWGYDGSCIELNVNSPDVDDYLHDILDKN